MRSPRALPAASESCLGQALALDPALATRWESAWRAAAARADAGEEALSEAPMPGSGLADLLCALDPDATSASWAGLASSMARAAAPGLGDEERAGGWWMALCLEPDPEGALAGSEPARWRMRELAAFLERGAARPTLAAHHPALGLADALAEGLLSARSPKAAFGALSLAAGPALWARLRVEGLCRPWSGSLAERLAARVLARQLPGGRARPWEASRLASLGEGMRESGALGAAELADALADKAWLAWPRGFAPDGLARRRWREAATLFLGAQKTAQLAEALRELGASPAAEALGEPPEERERAELGSLVEPLADRGRGKDGRL